VTRVPDVQSIYVVVAGAKMGDYLRDLGIPGTGRVQNYTGPGLSDGAFQSSVEFGVSTPVNDLDALARLHDSAYAKYPDRAHRRVADRIFADAAAKIPNSEALLAGSLVRYGNQARGAFSNISKRASDGALFGPMGALGGVIYGGIENALDLHDYMLHGDQYEKEILAYYGTDPHANLQLGGDKKNQTTFNIPKTRWNNPRAKVQMEKTGTYDPQPPPVRHARTPEQLADIAQFNEETTRWQQRQKDNKTFPPKAKQVLGISSDQIKDGHAYSHVIPVERGQAGVIDAYNPDGSSFWGYKPPRRKRKKRNKIYIDNL